MRTAKQRIHAELVWGRSGSRLNTAGASIDLGRISLSEAQKRAWMCAARMVVVDEDAQALDAVARQASGLPLARTP